jgi:hypothetical protein
VDRSTCEHDGHLERIERLVLDLAERRPVDRVPGLCVESLEVEAVHTIADLFVAGEADPNRPMLQLGVLEEVVDGGHDLGDARLVVRSEQRRAVARHELVADVICELRADLRVERDSGVARKRQPASLVANDLRLDVVGRGVVGDVDVREERNRRRGTVGRRGQCREHVELLVELRVLEAELLELGDEQAREVELLRGARHGRCDRIGLRVDADVPEEALEGIRRGREGERGAVPGSGLLVRDLALSAHSVAP